MLDAAGNMCNIRQGASHWQHGECVYTSKKEYAVLTGICRAGHAQDRLLLLSLPCCTQEVAIGAAGCMGGVHA